MILYGLKTCDSCRKALKKLPEVEYVDVRKDGVPADVMGRALEEFGPKLVNRSSATWRELGTEDRAREPAELLAEHPTLMKRPLIESDGALYLGWGPDVRTALGVAD
ncbi:ArsC/Spx/MgsR family protein [Chachezhania antarctica]|mgnify:CR=1 FL=1|uniref:ArsC/Spx/MgsR family protein n=1 Tax=Chachezhania antarctica TaxID=2340860 RepID=UPI000EB54067|nr:ArsC/Spx/MgsR family protein [Chachezhania antarctica]